MGNVIEEFAAVMGWDVDDRQLKSMSDTVDKTEKRIQKLGQVAKYVASIIGGALFVGTNKATAEMEALSDSVGVSSNLLQAMTHEVQIAGFNFENVVSMVEELNNKLGESKGVEEMTAVAEATQILGLSFDELSKKTPEEQFRAVTDAALALEDQQKAVAAADILMGGESNRIIGIMRARSRSLAEVEQRHKELSAVTESGKEGATAFTLAWNDFSKAISSIATQISGMVGGAMVPMLETVTDITVAVAKWINSGLERFLEQVNHWLRAIGITIAIVMAMKFLIWLNRMIIMARAAAAALTLMNVAAAILPLLVFAAAAAVGLLIDDLMTLQEGGDSLIGGWLEKFPVALDFVKSLLSGIGEAFQFVYGILEYIGKAIGNTAGMIHVTVANLIDFIVSIPDKIRSVIGEVSGFASGILDSIGGLFGGSFNGEVVANGGEVSPTGTLSAVGAASGSVNGGSVNNNIQMNITQQQGEDGVAFAERVSNTINQQMARAVRNTNNGVEY